MTFNMIPGLDVGDSPSKPPIENPMITKKNKDSSSDKIATTYKIQILYRTKIVKRDVDVIEKMKCLMARLFQYDKSLQMFPYCGSNKSNPITTAKDIPHDLESFQIYIPDASINPKSKTLRMSFKITSELRLWQLKMIQGIRNYLTTYRIYLDETYLVTLDNVKVGGLILSHPQFTRRDTATRDLNRRINENEDTNIPVQLSPSNIWNSIGNKYPQKCWQWNAPRKMHTWSNRGYSLNFLTSQNQCNIVIPDTLNLYHLMPQEQSQIK